jgi:hypothetical protein
MSTKECKLESPTDWECWRWQFQMTARATDLWEVVQGLEDPIWKPAEPDINSYPLTAVVAQMCAQAAEDSQSTI